MNRITSEEDDMETEARQRAAVNIQTSTVDQALLPMMADDRDIAEADRLIPQVVSVASIAAKAKNALAVIEARTDLLKALRKAAIAGTQPEDWDMKKDNEGRVMASPGRGAAEWFIQLYGVNFENMRDTEGNKIDIPVVTTNTDGSHSAVLVLDAYSVMTGQRIEGVRGERNDHEDFSGRNLDSTPEAVRRADLLSSTYTAARKKAAMALSGITKVSEALLRDHGLDTSRCTKGSGFGSGNERRTGAAATDDTKVTVDTFKTRLIGYCGGDEKEALVELAKLTHNEKGGKTYESKTWSHFLGSPEWAIKKVIAKFEAQIAAEEGR
jgi:hypothetical protein